MNDANNKKKNKYYADTKAYRDEYYKRPDVKKRLTKQRSIKKMWSTINRLEKHTYEELLEMMQLFCASRNINYEEYESEIGATMALFSK